MSRARKHLNGKSKQQTSTTHIAGPRIEVTGRTRQVCIFCGEVLADSKNAAVAQDEDGRFPEFPTWENGKLVRVTHGFPIQSEVLPNTPDDPLPEDFCGNQLE